MPGIRTLNDYPSVPDTPPPVDKDKGVANIENELQCERQYLNALYKENQELEKIIGTLDKEMNYIKSNFPNNIEEGTIRAGNELWLTFQSQREVNRKLERERKHLDMEIKQIEEQGVVNLDSLTQGELILYVKQLERTKTDLTSDLRANEWSLDKQAKESHHLEQLRIALEAEIRHYDEELAMFRHYNKTSCPSATSRSSLQVLKKSDQGGSVMFSSLDGSSTRRQRNLSPMSGFTRRSVKGNIADNQRVIDPNKGPINKKASAGTLPSITPGKKASRSSGTETPEIVVTDTTHGKISEPPFELNTSGPLVFHSPRNFENSPPPKATQGFNFDEDTVRGPVAEVGHSGEVTVRLHNGTAITIQINVEDSGECPTCRLKKNVETCKEKI